MSLHHFLICELHSHLLLGTICLAVLVCAIPRSAGAADASVEFSIVDENGRPLPCRIHLFDEAGKPQRPPELPFSHDHFVCPGNAKLQLAAGTYHYLAERGPEYLRQEGSFGLTEGGSEKVTFQLKRLVDLAARGWFAGDLHVHRALEDMELLMQAEDLHVAPVITWWNDENLWADRSIPEKRLVRFDGNRFYRVMAGEDEREGGALMYFHLDQPPGIAGASPEYPSPMEFVHLIRRRESVWIDIEKPFWWDVPVWLASGQMDSVGLANNHMGHSTMYETEAWGRPRDAERLPPPRGNGFWTQEFYYHILDSGLRVPPSAGSASGVLPNPVGYNRVYVYTGEDFTYESWWEGLKAGRSFVTNGPILLVKANNHLPGHVFAADEGEEVHVTLDVSLTTLDDVPAVEIVRNGRVEQSIPPSQLSGSGDFPAVSFKQSGWFLVRAITDKANTFRFASTAPFYVEIGPAKRRISKQSVRFFLDWIDERIQRVPEKLNDPGRLAEVLSFHEEAKAFWRNALAKANAE